MEKIIYLFEGDKMESNIANELNCKFNPIVLIKTDKAPEDAIGPKSARGGCIMAFISKVITSGKTAVFTKETCSCNGGKVALGFGAGFETPEAIENHCCFLACGLDSADDKEKYGEFLSNLPKPTREMFSVGERIFTDYETAKENITKHRPIYNNEEKYVVFKPLEDLEEGEIPSSVIFTVNPLELSALIHLDGSWRSDYAYTITAQSAACQDMGNMVFKQAESDNPRPVLGLSDFAGRKHIRKVIPDEYLTYALTWDLFLKLEEISKKSIFQTPVWEKFKK